MKRLALLAVAAAISVLAHTAEPPVAGYELALVDMQGQKKILGNLPASVFAPRVSPDGSKVAYEAADPEFGPQSRRLYVAPLDQLDNPVALQMTVTTKQNLAPVWNPEGDMIAFLATGNASDDLYMERSDGGIQPVYLVDGRAVEGWYRNGLISFITLTGDRDYGISLLDVNTKQVTRLIDQAGTEQHSARLSPDMQWIAYASNETGRQEVWLEPLPRTGQRYQLTNNGGRHPQWSPDGTKIYFDSADNQIFRLDLSFSSGVAQAGTAVKLPIRGFVQGDLRRQYDLMPDGKEFLMLFAHLVP